MMVYVLCTQEAKLQRLSKYFQWFQQIIVDASCLDAFINIVVDDISIIISPQK